MRFIHLSDLHLGRNINQVSLLDDQRYVLMEQILPIIQERKADAVLISGDIFDTYNPSGAAMDLYDEFLTTVIGLHIPVLAITGNHDSGQRVGHHHSLLEKANYYIVSQYDGHIYQITLNDEYGPVHFYLLPYIAPEDVRATLEDPTRSLSFDDAVSEVISREVVNTKERNVILSHQFIMGGVREDSDTKPMVAGADAISLSRFDEFDYVALGHIHKAQHFRTDGTCVYPGAILPYHINDFKQRYVSFTELLEKGKIHTELIPIKLKRDFVTIKGTYKEFMAMPGDDRNYIYAIITGKDTSISLVSDLRGKFPNLLHIEIQRDEDIQEVEDVNVDSTKDSLELIQDFYRLRAGVDMSEEEKKIVEGIYDSCKGDKQ